ncbi:hypothetical protein TNCV_1901641 [Trichonephila clavipes]|nr:hypothetical protein TNCV_1901641 [Trichonephila clavipes]
MTPELSPHSPSMGGQADLKYISLYTADLRWHQDSPNASHEFVRKHDHWLSRPQQHLSLQDRENPNPTRNIRNTFYENSSVSTAVNLSLLTREKQKNGTLRARAVTFCFYR